MWPADNKRLYTSIAQQLLLVTVLPPEHILIADQSQLLLLRLRVVIVINICHLHMWVSSLRV